MVLLDAWWEFAKEIGRGAMDFIVHKFLPLYGWWCVLCIVFFVSALSANLIFESKQKRREEREAKENVQKDEKGGEQDAENEFDRQNDPGFPV